jgi:FixJ family two-component response regulator
VLPEEAYTVFVVDDDESVRKALRRLLRANGFEVMTFGSAEDFLASGRVQTGGCIVLDIRLSGMSGLDLYEELASSGSDYPVIFITAHDNPQWRESAMGMGAVGYLRKPFDEQALCDAVNAARRRQPIGPFVGDEKIGH